MTRSTSSGTPPALPGPASSTTSSRGTRRRRTGRRGSRQLAAERPDIAHIIKSPFSSDGYMRPAQAAIGCSVVDGRRQLERSAAARRRWARSPAGYASPSNCSNATHAGLGGDARVEADGEPVPRRSRRPRPARRHRPRQRDHVPDRRSDAAVRRRAAVPVRDDGREPRHGDGERDQADARDERGGTAIDTTATTGQNTAQGRRGRDQRQHGRRGAGDGAPLPAGVHDGRPAATRATASSP